MAKHKHLTLEERFNISNLLDKQTSFKAIGLELGKDCTTISKEIRNHRISKKTGAYGKAFNNCKNRYHCDHRLLCGHCNRNRFCWSCGKCTTELLHTNVKCRWNAIITANVPLIASALQTVLTTVLSAAPDMTVLPVPVTAALTGHTAGLTSTSSPEDAHMDYKSVLVDSG